MKEKGIEYIKESRYARHAPFLLYFGASSHPSIDAISSMLDELDWIDPHILRNTALFFIPSKGGSIESPCNSHEEDTRTATAVPSSSFLLHWPYFNCTSKVELMKSHTHTHTLLRHLLTSLSGGRLHEGEGRLCSMPLTIVSSRNGAFERSLLLSSLQVFSVFDQTIDI